MRSNPYKLSLNHHKSVKRWAHTIHQNDALGTLSKFEMTRIHSLVQRHLRVLMCQDSNSSLIPPSLSILEKDALLDRFPVGAELPGPTSEPSISVTDFKNTGFHMTPDHFPEVEKEFKRWGIRRFSFDYEADFDDRVNNLGCQIFWNSFHHAIDNHAYHLKINIDLLTREVILRVLSTQFNRLAVMYRNQCKNSEVLAYHYMIAQKKKVFEEYRDFLLKSGADPVYISIFQPRNYTMMGDVFEVKVVAGQHSVDELHVAIPEWWSRKTLAFMETIENRVEFHATCRESFPRGGRTPIKFITASETNYSFVTRHLPANMYSKKFKDSLLPVDLSALGMKPSIIPDVEYMPTILPADKSEVNYHPLGGLVDDRYSSDDELSSDEVSNFDPESLESNPADDQPNITDVETRFETQISALQTELQNSIAAFSDFQNEIQNAMPIRLEELKKARDDINDINSKLVSIQNMIEPVEKGRPSTDIDQDSDSLPAASDIFA